MDKNRFKNPYFWLGLFGLFNVALTTAGINAEDLTTWGILFNSLLDILKNPYTLISITLALLGIWADPTTKGIKDIKK